MDNSNKDAPRIVILGSVNMDLVFRTPRMPGKGETISGHQFLQVSGGKGANQAVAAARQGAQVSLLARVGDDAMGRQLCQTLAQDGIDIAAVQAVPGVATGVAGILVDDGGENSIVLAAGANACIGAAEVAAQAEMIRAADFLVCQLETPLAGVEQAISIAHQAGVPVIFNPTPVQDLSDALLAQVDYLIVNETEAAQLSGIAVPDSAAAGQAAQKLLARGARQVVVTLGAQGVLLAFKQQAADGASGMRLLPSFSVQALDTTAAGDTFVGTLAVGLGRGQSLTDACATAQAAAAISVTRLGAQSSIPQRAEVAAFLVQHAG
ncbi:MAG: ribokinase [Pseudomonadota bacterium]|jgi:ribokinase